MVEALDLLCEEQRASGAILGAIFRAFGYLDEIGKFRQAC
jgi:hypothetical protein